MQFSAYLPNKFTQAVLTVLLVYTCWSQSVQLYLLETEAAHFGKQKRKGKATTAQSYSSTLQ